MLVSIRNKNTCDLLLGCKLGNNHFLVKVVLMASKVTFVFLSIYSEHFSEPSIFQLMPHINGENLHMAYTDVKFRDPESICNEALIFFFKIHQILFFFWYIIDIFKSKIKSVFE